MLYVSRVTFATMPNTPVLPPPHPHITTGNNACHAPVQLRLEELRVFRHSARSITVWADPIAVPHPNTAAAMAAAADGGAQAEPAAPVGLVAVQALLEAEFPACTDLGADEGRGIRGFVPHLSLGQLRVGRGL